VSDDARPCAADAPIYLDHNATTPIAPEVLDAVRPYLQDRFGNPSSAHRYGTVARRPSRRAQLVGRSELEGAETA
jgi:cysteine sulfinate desulfinase/cysteine desulfurase-like protein